MPQILTAIAAKVMFVVNSGGIGAFLLKFAGATLLSIASSKLFAPKIPQGVGLRGQQIMTRSGIEYRNLVYGKAMVSGPVVYNNLSGPTGQWLWYVVAVAHGENEDIEAVWFDNDSIPKADINWTVGTAGADGTGDGAVSTVKWVGDNSTTAVNIFLYPGHPDQVVCGELDSAFSQIDTTHRGRNMAYVVVKLAYLPDTEKVWKGGPPQDIKALVKGRKIYDPRLDTTRVIDSTTSPVTMGSGAHRYGTASTWEWSENPALCVADYMTQIMEIAEDSIDWESFASAADDCDVLVPIPPAASPENTQARFTCNGSISLGASHKDNLDALISSCDGKLSYASGKWKLRASVWEASSVSITESDLAGAVEVRGSAPKAERFNLIRGFFVDPSRKYQSAEFPHVTSSTYLTRDNNDEIIYDMQLPLTNNKYMAQRIAFRTLHQGNNQIVCVLNMNTRGAKIAVGDVVDVTIDHLGWSAKTFRCIEWARNSDGAFKVTLREDVSTAYDDPAVVDYTDVGSTDVTVPSDVVPAPDGLTATAEAAGVRLAWNSPAGAEHDFIDIYESTGSVFDTSPELARIARVRASNYLVPHDTDSTTYYYWIKAIRLPSLESERYPDNTNSPETSVSATMGASLPPAAPVQLTGATLLDVSVTPTDAEVGYQLNTSGKEQSYEGVGNPYANIADWLVSGSVGDYECRLTVDSGTAPAGSATGSWLALSSARAWTLTDSGVVGPVISNSCTVEIRHATTQTVHAAKTVTMSVHEEA